MDVARQAPLSTGFPRQEYWSRFPFPCSRGIFLIQGSKPRLSWRLLLWQADYQIPINDSRIAQDHTSKPQSLSSASSSPFQKRTRAWAQSYGKNEDPGPQRTTPLSGGRTLCGCCPHILLFNPHSHPLTRE